MMNTAFVFPGQGSQIVGMGKDFYNNFLQAKEIFHFADNILDYKLSDIVFNGPSEELTLTKHAQPAIMLISIVIINVICAQLNLPINNLCNYVAGHSLGEYSALCAAGSLSISDTIKLLKIRGNAMQLACEPGVGSMAACIGIDLLSLTSILNDIDSGVCQIANDNINEQIVISGHTQNVERVIAIVNDLGYKAIRLQVSAPFHCSLMKPAELAMSKALEHINVTPPKVPVITNVTAEPVIMPNIIKQNLIEQVCTRVRWRETLDKLNELGVNTVVEVGNGKVLTRMLKKNGYQFQLINIGTISELDYFCNNFSIQSSQIVSNAV